jgi:hypothetical protein
MTLTETAVEALGEPTLAELAEALHGELVAPASEQYDQARAIWNGAHDARPALIIRAAGVSDVLREWSSPAAKASRWRCAVAGTASPASPPPTAESSSTSPR